MGLCSLLDVSLVSQRRRSGAIGFTYCAFTLVELLPISIGKALQGRRRNGLPLEGGLVIAQRSMACITRSIQERFGAVRQGRVEAGVSVCRVLLGSKAAIAIVDVLILRNVSTVARRSLDILQWGVERSGGVERILMPSRRRGLNERMVGL